MLFSAITASLVFAAGAIAQATPAGFLPAVNQTLDVYYGTTFITPGLMVRKSGKSIGVQQTSPSLDTDADTVTVTARAPTIGVTNATLTGKYLLAMIGKLPIKDTHLLVSEIENIH